MLALRQSIHVLRPALTWQAYCEFGERTGFAVDADRPTMLLGYNIVADRQSEPGTFPGRLGRKERLEQLVPDLGRDTDPIVAHPYFDGLAALSGRDCQNRPV